METQEVRGQKLHAPQQLCENYLQTVMPSEKEATAGSTLPPFFSQQPQSPTNIPLVFSHLEHTTEPEGRISTASGIHQRTAEEIVDSFNSLHVTDRNCVRTVSCPADESPVPQDVALLYRTCRQELCAPCYLDDTTVDDLVGYFEQMLYLPKPMSDMAELMYA